MTDNCADCGRDTADMFNCDKAGNRIDGYLCFPCWKAKHPVMQRVETSMDGISRGFMYSILCYIALTVVIFTIYKIWSTLL